MANKLGIRNRSSGLYHQMLRKDETPKHQSVPINDTHDNLKTEPQIFKIGDYGGLRQYLENERGGRRITLQEKLRSGLFGEFYEEIQDTRD